MRIRKLLVVAGWLLAVAGCEQEHPVDTDSTTSDFETVRVDDDDVRYLYYDPAIGFHAARRLEEIPIFARSTVVVYRESEGSPELDATTFRVGKLLDAGPGDSFERVVMSRKALLRRTHTAQNAQRRAEAIVFDAQEISQLDPRSERSQRSRKALQLLEERMPSESESSQTPPDTRDQR